MSSADVNAAKTRQVVNLPIAGLAEAFGTFCLVFAGGITLAELLPKNLPSILVPLLYAAILLVMVSVLGQVSGCHLNPAITLGQLLTNPSFTLLQAVTYIVAQFGGGIGAAVVVQMVTGRNEAGLAKPVDGFGFWSVLWWEFGLTFVFGLVVAMALIDGRIEGPNAALAISAALFLVIFIGGFFTGGAINPARTFGPMFVAGNYNFLAAYLFGQFGGGLAGALVANLFKMGNDPVTVEESKEDSTTA